RCGRGQLPVRRAEQRGESRRAVVSEQVPEEDQQLVLVTGHVRGDLPGRGAPRGEFRGQVGRRAAAAQRGDAGPAGGEPLDLGGRLAVELVEQLLRGRRIVQQRGERGQRY